MLTLGIQNSNRRVCVFLAGCAMISFVCFVLGVPWAIVVTAVCLTVIWIRTRS